MNSKLRLLRLEGKFVQSYFKTSVSSSTITSILPLEEHRLPPSISSPSGSWNPHLCLCHVQTRPRQHPEQLNVKQASVHSKLCCSSPHSHLYPWHHPRPPETPPASCFAANSIKILLTFKALSNLVLSCLTDVLHHHKPPCDLRSSDANPLSVPLMNKNLEGRSVLSLPEHIRDSSELTLLK